ncbi:MAG TPA: ATP-binding protein [Mesorhizobium sp.]
MRRFLPQTLPAWVLLVVITGLLVSQLTTFYLVQRDRAASNDVVELYRLNERTFSYVQLMHKASPPDRKQLAAGLSNSGNALTVSDTPVVSSPIATDDSLAELEDILVGRLSKFGVIDARVRRDAAERDATGLGQTDTDTELGQVERDLLALATNFAKSKKLTASVEFADGQWLNFTTPITPVAPVLNLDSTPLSAIVAALVVIMSIWSLRRLTAPYRTLERAVGKISADLRSPPLDENGSREYRSAARALNAMQLRLREYVEDREQLAAALAHDLRTPLTRMRLRLELLGRSKARTALAHDLSDIDQIARSVIDFATFEMAEEKPERIDLASLASSIADSYDTVSFEREAERGMVCAARPIALRRCITNLVNNAVLYGKRVHLDLHRNGGNIALTIRDEGPGIAPEQFEQVFRPFVRIETSRSRETGGSGLGLTIARNIARSMGGDVRLSNHPLGGLCAELTLPAITVTA